MVWVTCVVEMLRSQKGHVKTTWRLVTAESHNQHLAGGTKREDRPQQRLELHQG